MMRRLPTPRDGHARARLRSTWPRRELAGTPGAPLRDQETFDERAAAARLDADRRTRLCVGRTRARRRRLERAREGTRRVAGRAVDECSPDEEAYAGRARRTLRGRDVVLLYVGSLSAAHSRRRAAKSRGTSARGGWRAEATETRPHTLVDGRPPRAAEPCHHKSPARRLRSRAQRLAIEHVLGASWRARAARDASAPPAAAAREADAAAIASPSVPRRLLQLPEHDPRLRVLRAPSTSATPAALGGRAARSPACPPPARRRSRARAT